MKRMKAFLAALALFLLTVVVCHYYIEQKVSSDNPEVSTWPSEDKSISRAGITENLNAGSIPVFGSSEFQHGIDTIYHPSAIFKGNRFNPMLIGAGYYQSLCHAITLAAIEPYMENRKAVLILSPQWFRKPGVVNQAFSSRFSEALYTGMLQNPRLSEEVRSYIADRSQLLLEVDEKTLDHVQLHNKILWKKAGTPVEKGQEYLWNLFLDEKDRFQFSASVIASGIKEGTGLPETDEEPDWDGLLDQAENDGIQENTNQFYIDDTMYKKLEPHLEEKKDMNKDAVKGYQNSPEYDDLRCFLSVCQELEIQPMIVILPVNGYYYDFTGFPGEARQKYYANVRAVATEFNARVADFADQEYTKYFFEDRVHLGKKGWVMICESLYDFYKEREE